MENSIDEKVIYKEHPIYVAARKIRAQGYATGTNYGRIEDKVGRDSAGNFVLGIIEPKQPEAKGLLGKLGIKTEQRGNRLGTLWFDDGEGAKHDEKWVLEVYGRENLPILTEIVKELSNLYNVKVEINLVSEKPKIECLERDNDF